MRIRRHPDRSRNSAVRLRILLAAVALLASNPGCHVKEVAYSCAAACPGKDVERYVWCENEKLQDALDAKGCPAQTQCTAEVWGGACGATF
jgi:hypothetical protein